MEGLGFEAKADRLLVEVCTSGLYSGGWRSGSDCNVAGRKKGKEHEKVLYNHILFTIAIVHCQLLSGCYVKYKQHELASVACSNQVGIFRPAADRHEPWALSCLCLCFCPVNRAICQQSTLGGPVVEGGSCTVPMCPGVCCLPAVLPLQAQPNYLRRGAAPSILRGSCLKRSPPGGCLTSCDLLIPPLEGAL